MKTEIELVDNTGDRYKFRYDYLCSSSLAIVEFGKQNKEHSDFGVELIAEHICREFKVSPLTLTVFGKIEGDLNMMQFSEFKKDQFGVYTKNIISYSGIKEAN